MNDYIELRKSDFEDVVSFLRGEMRALRSGVANPAMLDNVSVEAYGVRTPIKQLASITVPDAKTLLVSPWDKSILKDIERGIVEAKLGVNPNTIGEGVLISLPPLTQENRKDLVKIILNKTEESKVKARMIRDEVKASILEAEKNKEIAEDDKYRFVKEMDDYIHQFNERLKQMAVEKETEIMKI
ncbi:MAG: ribosome recycling factor [Parcubacteria group bacterium Gr01-1014_18]|nr:MAG: ribosome recycling factor [Parcubacteria group bacterium Greene0416_36]TSC81524.1 MAG: ribosome recycling factor [Parcubacteria group bacterium Gr01-1014_18]TSC99665.1 MAG: ribosome recycling factor [Parcubacteria group bacterium Greene1014_20]TSD07116.1 MAG: ribosome recycling factor [Parcubacteria group bacterium Greene0714_2]